MPKHSDRNSYNSGYLLFQTTVLFSKIFFKSKPCKSFCGLKVIVVYYVCHCMFVCDCVYGKRTWKYHNILICRDTQRDTVTVGRAEQAQRMPISMETLCCHLNSKLDRDQITRVRENTLSGPRLGRSWLPRAHLVQEQREWNILDIQA